MLTYLLLALALLGACALLSEGPPENVCRTDDECFRAQGEICDVERNRCVPGDAGVIDTPADAGTDATSR